MPLAWSYWFFCGYMTLFSKNASNCNSIFTYCYLVNTFFFLFFSLKDWKTRLSYFLQNSSSPGKPKTGKKSKQQTFMK
jgi:hypothetical protein